MDGTAAEEGLEARPGQGGTWKVKGILPSCHFTLHLVPQVNATGQPEVINLGHKSPLAEQESCHLIGWQWGCGNNEGHLLRLEDLLWIQLGLTDILRSW